MTRDFLNLVILVGESAVIIVAVGVYFAIITDLHANTFMQTYNVIMLKGNNQRLCPKPKPKKRYKTVILLQQKLFRDKFRIASVVFR